MNVEFSQRELMAIKQLAELMDVSPDGVVIQGLRLLQSYKLGYVQLTFPRTMMDAVFTSEPVSTKPENLMECRTVKP